CTVHPMSWRGCSTVTMTCAAGARAAGPPRGVSSPSACSDLPGHAMRIVSWNIRAGGGSRTVAIADQLARWSPDVVALSEFRATPPSVDLSRVLAQRGLTYQLCTAFAGLPRVNALLVASRWPL